MRIDCRVGLHYPLVNRQSLPHLVHRHSQLLRGKGEVMNLVFCLPRINNLLTCSSQASDPAQIVSYSIVIENKCDEAFSFLQEWHQFQ